MCPSPLETQINCFSLIYSFTATVILIGWSTVINFIEHISMAHPLCHALFTQWELGIMRYTYWARGQQYSHRPHLLASPCRTREPRVQRLRWGCDRLLRDGDWLHWGCDMQELANCSIASRCSKKPPNSWVPGKWVLRVTTWALVGWGGWDNCCCGSTDICSSQNTSSVTAPIPGCSKPQHRARVLGGKHTHGNKRV